MPYPYNNDLGIKPPHKAHKPKTSIKQIDEDLKAMYETVLQTDEYKAAFQKEMQTKLFGANPQTVKFPNVHPSVIPKDYGNHPASKQGKPDNSTKSDEELNAKMMKQLAYYGIDPYGNMPIVQHKDFSTQAVDPYYYMKSKVTAATPTPKYDFFTNYKPGFGGYEVGVKLKVAGLGIDAAVMGVHQAVSGQAADNMTPQQLSIMLDDMLARLKENIMIEIQKKAGM